MTSIIILIVYLALIWATIISSISVQLKIRKLSSLSDRLAKKLEKLNTKVFDLDADLLNQKVALRREYNDDIQSWRSWVEREAKGVVNECKAKVFDMYGLKHDGMHEL